MAAAATGVDKAAARVLQAAIARARSVVVLTGAGCSAESGVPTFRGPGGYWRTWQATELATPEAFDANPSLVWEFYHYRRELIATKKPNMAHYALAELQRRCQKQDIAFTLLTQNIDGLHAAAGSTDVVELHGGLWKTRCTSRKCRDVALNTTNPICKALAGKGAPDPGEPDARIPVSQLPRCGKCGSLVRPHVVWFGESLNEEIMDRAWQSCDLADVMLVVGTSALVAPASGFAPLVARRGGMVAEFNLENTPLFHSCKLAFHGPSGITLPEALGYTEDEIMPK